jgi:putative ABC transport system permease protein
MTSVLGSLRAQGRRAVAMVLSVAAAVAAFLVLTASAESTALQLTHTVDANFRSSYDLLVRPAGSRTELERDRGVVRPNYLSGIFGGITRSQLKSVEGLPGVEVAAPIAMVGTILQSVMLPVDLTDEAGQRGRALLRYSTRYVSQRGQTATPGQLGYVYVTPGTLKYRSPMDRPPYGDSEVTGDKTVVVCPEPDGTVGATTPFDVSARWSASCWSRTGGLGGEGWSLPGVTGLVKGHVGAILTWSFPVTLAAIDPDAEAALTGIDDAVVEGRFLHEGEQEVDDPSEFTSRVPIIVAKDALVDEQVEVSVDVLPRAVADQLAEGVDLASARRLVQRAEGRPVQPIRIDAGAAYEAWRQAARFGSIRSVESFWTPSPVSYTVGSNGHLEPQPQQNDPSVWASASNASGFVLVPSDAADTAYRSEAQHRVDPSAELRPRVDAVGTFDTATMPGFSDLSEVPLETYQPPTAEPGDAATRDLLGGQELLPNLNPAGYLQAPPLALTTLGAVDVFSDRGAFPGVDHAAPISVIRVRVAGVTGTDDASRERIQLVANQIRDRTGLDVDVTIGSSPAPETVDLPASAAGTPALSILEHWTKKGVAFALVDKIDRKSLILFLLILVASALTVVNAASASVRARRTEFGVLSCLGWRPGRIYRSVCLELAALGALAGIFGALAALPLSLVVGTPMPWTRAVLAVPTAVIITVLAGLLPAWRASRAEPAQAVRPSVRPARRASRLHGITSLSLAGVRRTPTRTITGAVALALGVCAMGVLIGILLGFHGAAVGTLLGDAIAVQVRTPDIVAACVLAALAFIALADILYLDLHEQAPRYASLKASGWRDGHLARLVVTQAGLIAGLGGALGSAAALGILQALGALTTETLLLAAAMGVAGIALSALVALAPALALTRLHPAEFLTQE